MSINAFPFLSQDGDRKVLYTMFRSLFSAYFRTGVFNTSGQNNIKVLASSGLTLAVKQGRFNINGVYGEIDTDTEVTLDSASSTVDRTDRICLRLNDNNESRDVSIVVLKGSSSGVQSLTRNDSIYDICIAEVLVSANATSITQANITDTRTDTDLCGIVATTIEEMDTTELFAQFESAWNTWFSTIKDNLDGDTAGNLQNQITELNTNITTLNDNLSAILAGSTAVLVKV